MTTNNVQCQVVGFVNVQQVNKQVRAHHVKVGSVIKTSRGDRQVQDVTFIPRTDFVKVVCCPDVSDEKKGRVMITFNKNTLVMLAE